MSLLSIKSSHLLLLFGLALFSLSLQTCNNDGEEPRARAWTLTWSDDFDGDAGQSPDPAKWTYDIGTGQGGWGNQELQFYTDRPENVSLDGDGNLVITAIREDFSGRAYTSARIKTRELFEQTYGRFETRLKTPFGQGLWPAFWMLGSNIDEVSWPQCGEIDIMELRGQQPNIALGSIHGPGYSAGESISSSYVLDNDRFDADFHTFAVEWGEDFIDFFVDDNLYQSIIPEDVPGEWVFDQPMYLLLNVAVGGNFLGFPTDLTPFPQTMTVDYIRVYEAAD